MINNTPEFQRSEVSDQENLSRIAEYLSRPGVKEIVRQIDQRFQGQPGLPLLYGITRNGLLVGVREMNNSDAVDAKPAYIQAMAVDITLPVDQIERKAIETNIGYGWASKMSDGGTIRFPRVGSGSSLDKLAELSEEEIKAKYPDNEKMQSMVKFYKQTRGFFIPSPSKEDVKPKVGMESIYPIDLS